ncbi:MAG: hypothetical protein ACFE7R_00430, partial [Candidatus Hodarchaeota archaeon]
HLVELASARFAQREAAIELMEKLRIGEAPSSASDELKEMAKSDLLVRIDYLEFAKELKKSRYVKMVQDIDKGLSSKNVEKLVSVHEQLTKDTDFPNRSVLLNKVSEALHRLTLSQFTLTYEQWLDLWTTVSIKFPKMTSILKDTLNAPKRKVIRTDGLTLVVYVTGDSSESPVFLEISGGVAALDIKKDIEQSLKE